VIIDPAARRVTARAPLGSGPDYVRYVAPTGEVWVTEPDSERIEIFGISPKRDKLTRVATIAVPGGPESLVVDSAGGRAFAHLWSGTSVVIDGKDAYVCDPDRGRLLVIRDSYPPATKS